MNEIIIYHANKSTQIDVKFVNNTVWLTQDQMVDLFKRDQSVISRHIRNTFKEKELKQKSNMQKMHIPNSDKPVTLYSLDVIISVGYRVKSLQGTQFRIWATQKLKEILVQGYAINQKRLDELQQTVQLIRKSIGEDTNVQEAKGLLEIISQYTQSFILLNQFDSNSIRDNKVDKNITYEINYQEAKAAITTLKKKLIEKKEATNLFGNEKDESFRGTLKSIVQTFGGQYLYTSIEEQAAHLLYFIIKNHPFTDGNKRIGAFLFIWF